ncbi:MAG: hypothetical protein C4525_09285 [Desulfarculus sp.]|jgi:hypothetical protein|nr:MAG: hypothetical protein C4525_09285 [Desulfarculus sp.]
MRPEVRTEEIEPGLEFAVDLMRPADAPGVAALFQSVYGQGYPIRTYLEPAALVEANQQGTIVSSVARTTRGDIVGHNAIFNSAPSPKVYESGAGVVLPSYRQGNIFSRMCRHGIEVAAPRFGVEMVFGEPVCNHVYSQKMTRTLGTVSLTLEVDLMPAAAYAREKSAEGRVAALLDFIIVRSKPHAVYLPGSYQEALTWLYAGLDEQRELRPAQGGPPAERVSRLEAHFFPFAQLVRLAAWEIGVDFAAALEAKEQEGLAQGAEVFQVWLPLGCPWVGAAAEELRARGYFFGGLLPRWFDADGMMMQKTTHRPHWEGIKLEFERAQKILVLVKRDWERTGQGHGS